MNQSVLFPDRQHWDEKRQVVSFPVQASGLLIECFVSKGYLETSVGDELLQERQIMLAFENLRFDLEELVEQLLEEEAFNEEGHLVIG
ncbi:DUF1488 domain-containing protein [Vibrio profundum]|uniref:DUF1488 domain-containing protein n=1 Tax=Vibrio profundum TaxID=2910247 RepID=UPI003D14BBA4